MKIIRAICFYTLIITLIIAATFLFMSPIQLKYGVYVKDPQSLAAFELTDHHGAKYTQEHLKGNWSIIFFGFSSCPMICPVTLDKLQKVNEQLSESNKLNIVFISVDPKNDTVARLNDYMRPFDKHFTALTGKMSVINALQQQFHVFVSTTPSSHGTEILLVNPQGQLQAYFNFTVTSEALLEDLHKIITE